MILHNSNDFMSWTVEAWTFRWSSACRHGCWVVSIAAFDRACQNFDAVMDDFGNLVRVQ